MCTVVCRWRAGANEPIELLALRDELASRTFDTPDQWWPGQPRVVGGRDRQAGGTWCACAIDEAITAVVLNRPERRVAEPGAASRGVLPLLAVKERVRWPEFVDVAPMAGFNLVLATPAELRWWSWDGVELTSRELDEGTHIVTPTRLELAPAEFSDIDESSADRWARWRAVIEDSEPGADSESLIVERPAGGDSYETVFGQHILSRPGLLRLDYAPRPRRGAAWTTRVWTAAG